MRFWYFHRLHRRRKVTPRRHPIPDPVEIVPQILLEVLDRAPVHARRSLIGLDSLVRLPHEPLRNTERLSRRLRLAHSIPPRAPLVARTNFATDGPAPSLPLHYKGFITTMSRSECRPRNGTQSLAVPAAWDAPSRRRFPAGQCRGQPSHVPREGRRPGSRRLHAGHHLASNRVSARLILEPRTRPSSDAVSTTFDTSAAIRLRSPSRSPPDASCGAFSSSLTTTVSSQRSMRRFDVTPRRATPKGHQSFILHAAAHQSRSPTYIPTGAHF